MELPKDLKGPIPKGTPIYAVAQYIKANWKPMDPYAQEYVIAMLDLTTIKDYHGALDGEAAILYFLSNAQTWRGEKARETKKYLNSLIKNK